LQALPSEANAPTCSTHQQLTTCFCQECNIRLCRQCIDNNHPKEHTLIENVNEEENDETVQNELDILRNRIESLKESISDAMNNCRTMRVRIQTRTQEVMVQIDQGFDQ
jgi:hypothetical protein